MNTSFEVGAIFKILDEASPQLRKMLELVRELSAAIKGASAELNKFAKPGLGAAISETNELAAAWRRVAEAAGAASRSTTRPPFVASSAGALVPFTGAQQALVPSGRFPPPPNVPTSSAPRINFPRNTGLAALGALGYGVYEESKMEDAVFQLLFHGGLPYDDANRKRFRDIIQGAMSDTGYPLEDIAEASKNEMRMFKGTRFRPGKGGEDVLPEMLRAAAIEARLKGTSLKESMTSLVGLSHMLKQYGPDAIKQLAPVFSFLSTADPRSLTSIERAAGYAVPMLQSGLGIDPLETLLASTALARSGVTSTKSGTWLRELALRALPGTKQHNYELAELGLIDENRKPTWYVNGKADLFKLIEIAGARAANLPSDRRARLERHLFGAQGSGALSVLADPIVQEQLGTLNQERNSPEFKNRYAAFMEDFLRQSPMQQFRTTLADFKNVLMDLGSNVLPAVTGALKDFDQALKMIEGWLPSNPSGGVRADDKKWSYGTSALEGAIGGGAVGTFVPGIGTVGGAVVGGLAGVATAAIHNFSVGVDQTGKKADHSAESVNKLTGSITGLGSAAAGAGGVFPGGTSRGDAHKMNYLQGPSKKQLLQPITLNVNLDGRTLGQAVSDAMEDLYTHAPQAPAFNGTQAFANPDTNYA